MLGIGNPVRSETDVVPACSTLSSLDNRHVNRCMQHIYSVVISVTPSSEGKQGPEKEGKEPAPGNVRALQERQQHTQSAVGRRAGGDSQGGTGRRACRRESSLVERWGGAELGLRSQALLERLWEFLNLWGPQFPTSKWL